MLYKANILVVDDDTAVCKSVAAVFKKEAGSVDMVFTGEEAAAKVQEKNYALAIVDLMLPDMSGLEVISRLKQLKPDLTIIMITGYPSIKTAVTAVKNGAYDYIPKPFTPAELRSLAARALEKRYAYEEISSRLGVEEEKLVKIEIPPGLYCIPEHSWAREDEDGSVRIGIHHALARSAHNLDRIEFPKINEIKYQGEACAGFMDAGVQVLRLWTPVSGKVIEVNESLKQELSRIFYDPYGEGWLIRVQPIQLEEDKKNLEPLV